MSLTVTVQKGHDFSTGNVTRAALNAGATPTVAVTGSVTATEIAAGSVTEAKLGADSVTQTVLKDDSSAGSANAAVTSDHIVDDAVTLAKIDDEAIVSDNLITKKNSDSNTNVIEGLTELADVAVDDWMMVHDTSVSVDEQTQLKKAKVSSVQKVGTTEYVVSSESDANGPTVAGTATAKTVEIDMDGSPFQTLGTDPPDGATTREYTFSLSNQSANSVKLVTIKIDGPSSDSADLAFPGWHWPERETGAPSSIATGKVAILSITSFGGSASTVIAAYAVT